MKRRERERERTIEEQARLLTFMTHEKHFARNYAGRSPEKERERGRENE